MQHPSSSRQFHFSRNRRGGGFTIIELLVVVSIIALLVGILLPAIGKARDQALLTKSQSQLSQLGKAAAIYAAEYADRQLTLINDNFAKYGANGNAAMSAFNAPANLEHPAVILGYGQGGIWGYFMEAPPAGAGPGNYVTAIPIEFSGANAKFGAFRITNCRQFNTFINGRFYDPTFYAPKDTAVYQSVESWFDYADEFVPTPGGGSVRWSSYCFSPAAMFNPDVLSLNKTSGKYYNAPYSSQASFRSPTMGSAAFPDLKTHIIEHNWCQNRKKVCNPNLAPPTYDGCEPYYFNGSWDSTPVSVMYDGHIEGIGTRDASASNARVVEQTGQPNHGLWSLDTPLAGVYSDYGDGGYFSDQALDWTSTSFHILTIEGIRGRDILSQ